MSKDKIGFRIALTDKQRMTIGRQFRHPDGSTVIIKRISTVEIKNGDVYVSGQCVEVGQR